MENIEERIKKLSPEDRATFELLEGLPKDKIRIMNKGVISRAEDRYWCKNNQVNYTNPDILQIAIYTYRELIAENKI